MTLRPAKYEKVAIFMEKIGKKENYEQRKYEKTDFSGLFLYDTDLENRKALLVSYL